MLGVFITIITGLTIATVINARRLYQRRNRIRDLEDTMRQNDMPIPSYKMHGF